MKDIAQLTREEEKKRFANVFQRENSHIECIHFAPWRLVYSFVCIFHGEDGQMYRTTITNNQMNE